MGFPTQRILLSSCNCIMPSVSAPRELLRMRRARPYATSTDASRELHARMRLHKRCECAHLLCPSSRCFVRDISLSLSLSLSLSHSLRWYAFGTRLVPVASLSLSLTLFAFGTPWSLLCGEWMRGRRPMGLRSTLFQQPHPLAYTE